MQLKTCVHAKLNKRYLNYVTLMDSNLTLQYFNLLGDPPLINDSPLPTNLLTLAGQIVTSINNSNLNNIPVLTLASGDIKGDCVGSRSSQAIANFNNPSVTNGESTDTWVISFYVSADYNVSGGGGGGSSIDYTNVLTNINSNLVLLKDSFKNVFEFPTGQSVLRGSEPYYLGFNVLSFLLKIHRLFVVGNPGSADTAIPDSNKLIYKIQSKLSETVSSVDVPLLKEIALAISSLASASDNQAIKALKDTISALELKVENNNVLLVDGQQEFCIKDYRELEPNSN